MVSQVEQVVDGQVVVDSVIEIEFEDGFYEVEKIEISVSREWVEYWTQGSDISVEAFVEQVEKWYDTSYPVLDWDIHCRGTSLVNWDGSPEGPTITLYGSSYEGDELDYMVADYEELEWLLDVDSLFEQDAWRVDR